jgi:alkylhydroperoxidase family enzyme
LTIPTPATPRLDPIDRTRATPDQAEQLDRLGRTGDLHLFRTLAHHPQLLRSWIRLGNHLLARSTLTDRDREIVILRVAWLCRSEYEWGQHIAIGRNAGLSDDEMRRIAADPSASTWSDWERTLLTATDELVVEHCLSDDTWAALAVSYTPEQLLELTMLAGQYAMLAGLLRSAGVQTETPLPALGEAS